MASMDRKSKANEGKRWLREASMKRLNMLIKNKKESIGEGFLCSEISADDVEASGLSPADRFHLNKWADGLESGRHCMLALLESKAASESDASRSTKGSVVGGPQQRPLEMAMLSATISLPDEFLCDSGYLYESIFSRAPGAVVREAMQLLAVKALEKTSSSLRIDQINLALKQLKVEKMTANVTVSGKEKRAENKVELESEEISGDKENNANGSSRASPSPTASSCASPATVDCDLKGLPPPPVRFNLLESFSIPSLTLFFILPLVLFCILSLLNQCHVRSSCHHLVMLFFSSFSPTSSSYFLLIIFILHHRPSSLYYIIIIIIIILRLISSLTR